MAESMETEILISLHTRSMWETIYDAEAGFWLNSKFLSKFSRKPLSGISDQKAPPPHFGKLQIWDDQSLLRNTPPTFWKTSDLRWPKFTPEYPTSPPFQKTSHLRWPKFTLEYPSPFRKTSDLRWPKFTLEYPPPFGKLQIWDDQSLLRNTLPISENFRFEMTKVYSGIPLPPFSENAGDRMWRLICNPQGYHSFHLLIIFLELRNVVFFIFHSKYRSSQSVHLMIAAGVDFFLVIVLEDGKKHPSHKIKTSCTDINWYRYMLHFCQIAFDFLVTFWAIKHKIRKSNV